MALESSSSKIPIKTLDKNNSSVTLLSIYALINSIKTVSLDFTADERNKFTDMIPKTDFIELYDFVTHGYIFDMNIGYNRTQMTDITKTFCSILNSPFLLSREKTSMASKPISSFVTTLRGCKLKNQIICPSLTFNAFHMLKFEPIAEPVRQFFVENKHLILWAEKEKLELHIDNRSNKTKKLDMTISFTEQIINTRLIKKEVMPRILTIEHDENKNLQFYDLKERMLDASIISTRHRINVIHEHIPYWILLTKQWKILSEIIINQPTHVLHTYIGQKKSAKITKELKFAGCYVIFILHHDIIHVYVGETKTMYERFNEHRSFGYSKNINALLVDKVLALSLTEHETFDNIFALTFIDTPTTTTEMRKTTETFLIELLKTKEYPHLNEKK